MIHVVHVAPLGDYRLGLIFSDGTSGEVNFEPLLERDFFKPLRDKELFAKAYADGYTVAWPGQVDVVPDTLYSFVHELPDAKTSEQADANELTVSLRQVRRYAKSDTLEGFEMSGITQERRAKIERGEEHSIDMLRRYVEALGGELEIVARVGKARVVLHGVGERSRGYGYVAPGDVTLFRNAVDETST